MACSGKRRAGNSRIVLPNTPFALAIVIAWQTTGDIMKSIIATLLVIISTSACAGDRRAERSEEMRRQTEEALQEHSAREQAGERSKQAGVCAMYLEAMKSGKADAAWKLAPDIGDARHAAEMWQIGFSSASGTLRTSYLHEGERGCAAVNVSPKE
jgi:hypothetical protein